MSKLKLVFFVFVALFVGNNVYAQNQNDVTLIVSADGDSKEEATKVALRSAIEQAYGTFVSANTTILNDELVQDEIVTVASGNIKDYKEITCKQMPNGKMFVTLQATVSISNLVSYAKSKGAETEFAGATFAMNVKMMELNKQNEAKVLNNMFAQLTALAESSNLYDYKMELDPTPKKKYNETAYTISGKIHLLYNANTQLYNEILFNTLMSLSLSKEERQKYREMNIRYYEVLFPKAQPNYGGYDRPDSYAFTFYLRTDSRERIERFIPSLYEFWGSKEHDDNNLLVASAQKFILSDNLSSPTKLSFHIVDTGISSGNCLTYYLKAGFSKVRLMQAKKIGDEVGVMKIEITIPEADLAKYSSVRIDPK